MWKLHLGHMYQFRLPLQPPLLSHSSSAPPNTLPSPILTSFLVNNPLSPLGGHPLGADWSWGLDLVQATVAAVRPWEQRSCHVLKTVFHSTYPSSNTLPPPPQPSVLTFFLPSSSMFTEPWGWGGAWHAQCYNQLSASALTAAHCREKFLWVRSAAALTCEYKQVSIWQIQRWVE